ncbi:hypothetical protein N8I77_000160 [Diaporthe amygdali]|uniref:AB hydrolase-1 domain-containing protein n=1 Tax=Phomopsis amygdali TaxID=1214568 RepID=A0AAD9SMT4_PHOAM|nr:hypothetical protein N8I77_000160 [Diaporthe amygdali]
MSSNKPAIVIIPGAFSTPESYAKLTVALQLHGYEVHVPRLVTTNESRPPNGYLEDDTSLIRSHVDSLVSAGRRVVGIAHSYGGQVMSNALYGLSLEARSSQGLEGGVSALVYMAGFALTEGISILDKLKEFGRLEDEVPLIFDVAEDQTMALLDPIAFLGLREPGTKESEIEAYVQTLRRWNGKAMMQPLERAAWKEIPVAYIHTTMDMPVPLETQQSMVRALEMAGRKVQTFTLETGHCPHFTATESVVDTVNKVVSSEFA